MARRKNDDLQKVTLNLRRGDMSKMAEMFPDIGSSVAIRTLVSTYLDKYYRTSSPKDIDANLSL